MIGHVFATIKIQKWKCNQFNLYIKEYQDNMIIIVVYDHDIIFGIDYDILSQNSTKNMQNEFEFLFLGS